MTKNSETHAVINFVAQFESKYPSLGKNFKKICDDQYELFCKKMLSYGIDNIALGTTLEDPEDVKLSLSGIWFRLNDKMNRLKNLVVKGNSNPLKDESLRDTWMDNVNYNIIAQLVSKGLWKK